LNQSSCTEKNNNCPIGPEAVNEADLLRQIKVLQDMLGRILGLEADGKAPESQPAEETGLHEQVAALYKLTFDEDIALSDTAQLGEVVKKIEDGIADIAARKTVERRLEKQVLEKLEKQQRQYMDELKLRLISEKGGVENANTLRRYAELEKKAFTKLARCAMELTRPSSLNEIVGQDRAVKSLITKLATPFPQHVIIYGPPGVGKTTAARLVLEMAREYDYTPFSKKAPFVEVDGTTLRWDPREIANPLLGSVHDPIYQGSRRDLAESGIPEPKPGLVTEAHGGVLFIDEIGELDIFLQNKLLKVLEDKRVSFDSAYYDPDDDRVPKYIKKLFDEGAPADFILIGATTRQPEEINAALRSRCAEVFFDPLSPESIRQIVLNAAAKINVALDRDVAEMISRYTMEGRKAVNLLTDAYGLALYKAGGRSSDITITKADLAEVIQISRLTPGSRVYASPGSEVGRIFGLGVSGFHGSVIEFEAAAFKCREGSAGTVRFNDTAGSMAKDAVANAASVVRKLTGEDIKGYDLHINAVGGGRIDGPSAGAAMALVILSAIKDIPIRQDIAITGEISLRGRIKPVGGVYEKICGARQAGMKKVIIPRENMNDAYTGMEGIEIIPVDSIEEAADIILELPLGLTA